MGFNTAVTLLSGMLVQRSGTHRRRPVRRSLELHAFLEAYLSPQTTMYLGNQNDDLV
jgi:hypothetical protein